MRALFFNLMTACGLLLLPPSPVLAAPVRYDFELIADTSGPFTKFLDFAINKSGTVAFSAQHGGGDIGIFTGRGSGPITTIAYTGAAGFVSINDSGTVVFNKPVKPDRTGGGLFTGRGGPLTTVVAAGDFSYPSINERGSIAVRRLTGPGDPGHDGPPTFEGFVVIDGKVSQIPRVFQLAAGSLMINNHDTVLFGERDALFSTINVSQGGRAPVVIAEAQSLPSGRPGSFSRLSAASINDAGTIAFLGSKRTEQMSEEGVYLIIRGEVRKVVSTVSGKAGGFFGYTPDIAINKKAAIAFAALLSAERSGIFTGQDPVENKVVAVGDTLFGSTVKEIGFSRHGLNNKGVLVFRAKLLNGREAIVRASPNID